MKPSIIFLLKDEGGIQGVEPDVPWGPNEGPDVPVSTDDTSGLSTDVDP